jgi:hypothetical protein
LAAFRLSSRRREPSKAIDDVYELVYHITGKLTTDWEGEKEYTPQLAASYVADFQANPMKQHQVVAHSVAVPNVPVKGQRQQPRRHIPVVASAPAARPAPALSVASPAYGGGCGTGGGCGSSYQAQSVAPPVSVGRVQRPVLTPSVGGGCGSNFGGGCGGSR